MYITPKDPDELKIPDELRQILTDNEAVGIEDLKDIQSAIDEAGAEINGHIGGRVDLDTVVEPYSDILKKLCRDMAIYNLWGLRPLLPIPESVQLRYDQAIAFLKRYAEKGIGSLGIEDTPETGGGDPVAEAPDPVDLDGY